MCLHSIRMYVGQQHRCRFPFLFHLFHFYVKHQLRNILLQFSNYILLHTLRVKTELWWFQKWEHQVIVFQEVKLKCKLANILVKNEFQGTSVRCSKLMRSCEWKRTHLLRLCRAFLTIFVTKFMFESEMNVWKIHQRWTDRHSFVWKIEPKCKRSCNDFEKELLSISMTNQSKCNDKCPKWPVLCCTLIRIDWKTWKMTAL